MTSIDTDYLIIGVGTAEICDYFNRVLAEHLPPSGQVRFFGMSDYEGNTPDGHRFVSRLDAAHGSAARIDEPPMQKAVARMLENTEPAMATLGELGAQVAATPAGLTSDNLGGGLH